MIMMMREIPEGLCGDSGSFCSIIVVARLAEVADQGGGIGINN